MIKPITLVSRKSFGTSYSIEYIYKALYKEFLKSGLPVKEVVLPFKSKNIIPRLRNILSVFIYKNEIVHITGDVHYALLGAIRSKRILTVHDVFFMDRTSGIKRHFYKWFWIELPVRFAHKVIAISDYVKADLLKHINIDPRKIEVIYDFVDEIYKPVKREFNSNKPRILQIGTKYNKNLPRLIYALEDLPCTLVIIGKLSQDIIDLLHKKNIDYINLSNLSLEDLHKEYIKADILSFVSIKEGFGMPILEAQSTGLPVVTSNCTAMPDIAGEAAILVNPFDIDSIRAGFVNMIKDASLREAIVAKGYVNVKRFSVQKVASDHIEVYKSLS